jgi:hypothetical protein
MHSHGLFTFKNRPCLSFEHEHEGADGEGADGEEGFGQRQLDFGACELNFCLGEIVRESQGEVRHSRLQSRGSVSQSTGVSWEVASHRGECLSGATTSMASLVGARQKTHFVPEQSQR